MFRSSAKNAERASAVNRQRMPSNDQGARLLGNGNVRVNGQGDVGRYICIFRPVRILRNGFIGTQIKGIGGSGKKGAAGKHSGQQLQRQMKLH